MTTVTELHHVPFSVDADDRSVAVDELNAWLVDLVALALRLKQAHWNLRGARFKSVHEQLDEILVDVRAAVDDVAERVVTIGGAADGRPRVVGEKHALSDFPSGRLTVEDAQAPTTSGATTTGMGSAVSGGSSAAPVSSNP